MSEVLCALADLDATGAKEIIRTDGKVRATMFVVRHDGKVYGYVNSCPHVRLPLNWSDDVFFDAGHTYIVCANHAARFDVATGLCVRGPCKGQALTPVPVHIEGENVILPGPFPQPMW